MFKPALGASIAGLFLLAGYSGGAPSAILAPSPDTPARIEPLMAGRAGAAVVRLSALPADIGVKPMTGTAQVHITQMISPANKPEVVVAAGLDRTNGNAYLAWSADHGSHWTDLSSMLPANQIKGRTANARVSQLMEDARGRLLLTMTDDGDTQGKVLVLTLGKKMDWLLL